MQIALSQFFFSESHTVHYISKNRMWVTDHDLVTPAIYPPSETGISYNDETIKGFIGK